MFSLPQYSMTMYTLIVFLGLVVISSAYENLALKKPTYQENRFTGLLVELSGASNAVDGLKSNLAYNGGQCVISESRQYSATWWVNLTKVLGIHHITIYYRTDNLPFGPSNPYTGRFLGFSLYISNTTNKYDGALCFKDTNFTNSTIPAIFNRTCYLHGQYIIYYNERLTNITYPDGYSIYAFNELCEVEVFGCPEPGYYGFNCSIPCPDTHCRYCHLETGVCQGCQPGYKGHNCEGCSSPGFYGSNCSIPCPDPHCRYCHIETGTCQECKPGYKGHNCEGCSSPGFYGSNCSIPCPDPHCRYCHIETGTCQECKPGYEGHKCELECQEGKYGQGCNSTCGHCKDEDHCYHTNGTCLNGCELAYHGFLCHTFNLAFHKPAYQEYRISGQLEKLSQASNAVDGLKSDLEIWGGECVISENAKRTATWWVNLTRILSIHHITIYYRTGNIEWAPGKTNGYSSRFLGFSLYVSNTTNKSDGTLCFKDTNFNLSTIPPVFNTTCFVHGQYVIYYNERLPGTTYPTGYSTYAFNELCELEVFGCPEPGFYGSDCSIPCPDLHCRYCHLETGACQGCEPGYEGHNCEKECTNGTYGNGCQQRCGHCKDLKQCHHVNGTCLDGCGPGYEGEFCSLDCSKGYFGAECKEQCGHCINLSQCHHIDGKCLGDCEAGFKGEYCRKECTNGTYGNECQQRCGHCKDLKQCHHVNGMCLDGCGPGYEGEYCSLECESGTYGNECKENCGNCFNSTDCFHVNGTCLNGCGPGYLGNLCTTPCSNATYGQYCIEKCGHCRDQRDCHNVNGSCLSGCEDGYRGELCNSICENGTYGQECNNTCGQCRGEEHCHHENGTCLNGCKPGYIGNLCKTECSAGYYGEHCTIACGNCFNGEPCHHINGSCLYGCSPGYQGSICIEACENGTYGQDCNNTCGHCLEEGYCEHTNGTCFSGCLSGYHGDFCKIQCVAGFFGDNCNGTCGNCSNGDPCHHINGSCLHGCDPNYQGLFCTEAKPYESPPTSPVGAILGVLIAIIVVIVITIFVIRRKRLKTPKYMKDRTSSIDTRKENSFDNQCYNDVENKNYMNDKGSISEDNMNQNNSNPYENEHDETNNENSNEQDETYVNVELPRGIRVKDLESIIARKRADENAGFKEEYAALPSGEKSKCDVGKKPENTSKNRYKTTFPYDHSRVILNITDKEPSDYINANYIDGFNRQKEYIAAQGPKPNTLGDFWRMIWQQDVTTIVMLTNLKEGDKIKCTQYWPNGNKARLFGTLSVKMTEEKEYAFFIKRTLSVSHLTKETHDVTQYHYIAWPDHGTPEPMNLLDFHYHVMSSINKSQAPTVVHCSAGVGRTGTFIALDALYREGNKTGLVNVSDFVKKMRQNRVSMVQTREQYITIFLALNEIFKAPLHMLSALDFCSKTEKTMKDNPANQNPLRKEFQLLHHVKPVYAETDYKMAMQACKGKPTDKVLPLDKYCVHLCSAVPNRGNYINAIFAPSITNSRRFIVTQYPVQEDAVDFIRLLCDHESDTVICLDPVSEVDASWLPECNSTNVFEPFTISCQSSTSRNDFIEHVINIRQIKQGDIPNVVEVFEPKKIINPLGNPLDTTELRGLVSKALSCTSEKPITVVSRDGASLCGIFMAVHNAIQQLEIDGGVDVFTTVRQLQIRRPELCGNVDEYTMAYTALYDYIQNNEENVYCNQ
uniref:protein-tyrosine-phosphatase n=1 Tax=Crassostrea virginica TaxID=6565 RepID=A0A8B8BZQ6_CRAVI|nr:uncharacterized protein LOC111114722 isoform X2 [Crassostrea virginica]